MDVVKLNVALRVPNDVAGQAIRLSKEISSRHKARFFLDGVEFHPHITVYATTYKESAEEDIYKIVKEAADNAFAVTLRYKGIHSRRGYIGVDFELTDNVRILHEALVGGLSPLREIDFEDKSYNMKFSAEQEQSIKDYGYPDAMSLYSPHMTIIRLEDEEAARVVARDFDWSIGEFVSDSIGVYKAGDSGTTKTLLREFALKKN